MQRWANLKTNITLKSHIFTEKYLHEFAKFEILIPKSHLSSQSKSGKIKAWMIIFNVNTISRFLPESSIISIQHLNPLTTRLYSSISVSCNRTGNAVIQHSNKICNFCASAFCRIVLIFSVTILPQNYQNWFMYVKVIASQQWELFLRHNLCAVKVSVNRCIFMNLLLTLILV